MKSEIERVNLNEAKDINGYAYFMIRGYLWNYQVNEI